MMCGFHRTALRSHSWPEQLIKDRTGVTTLSGQCPRTDRESHRSSRHRRNLQLTRAGARMENSSHSSPQGQYRETLLERHKKIKFGCCRSVAVNRDELPIFKMQ